ncbi:MAG: 8-oxo-dGTP diphosphatase [Verrucomicrobiales bacterium]
MRATLLFVVRSGRVLLIRKKRGLGAGKINGPGGRIEAGESALEGAVREVFEELRITVLDADLRGELHFDFADGLRLHCLVYLATKFDGEPTETDEAVPLWTPVSDIPFEQMWADDPRWLPQLLDGQKFRAWFKFDGEQMLWEDVKIGEGPSRHHEAPASVSEGDG